MSDQAHHIYALSGWGFSSGIFKYLNNTHLNFQGLDYQHLADKSLDDIAHHLSQDLADNSALMGWSFGGLLGIKLAELYPNKVKKLILLASQAKLLASPGWAGIKQDNANAFLHNMQTNPTQQLKRFHQLACFPSRDKTLRSLLKSHCLSTQTNSLRQLLEHLFETDLRQTYSQLNHDILHLSYEQDAVLAQNTTHIQQLNKQATIITLNGMGHAGFLSDPKIHQTHILEFLQS